MLSLHDDLPIHQTPDPIAVPSTSDRNFYERYWFNGYDRSGEVFFGIGTGIYPHRGILDAAISVLVDGTQHAFHVSGRAPSERSEVAVGPYRLDVVEPMRSIRVVLDDNETGVSCDLTFEGRTANVEEPRHQLWAGTRRLMDTTRFTQLGRWHGTISVGGDELTFDRADTWGTKDRSWGVRPVGEPESGGAPRHGGPGGIFFLWAPLNFDDLATHYQLFEDPQGRRLYEVGAHLPVYDAADDLPGVEDPGVVHLRALDYDLAFRRGTRMIEAARLSAVSIPDGARHEIDLELRQIFRMKGLGYRHPEWSQGVWKGELAMAAERWHVADVDERAIEHHHVQHVVTARMDDRVGVGVLEQNLIGPHLPTGLAGLFDPHH